MNKKAYLQISFAWLFAVIVGVFILFLAIFFSAKLIKTEQTIQDAKTSKEIGILLNPLETGFESGKSNYLNFPTETRLYNSCDEEGNFGVQKIRVSQKNFDKWSGTNLNSSFINKYIFSDTYEEGKEFYLFSQSFEMPFKIADLIIMTSADEKYCFENAPEEIKEEILFMNQKNLLAENCSGNEVTICSFGTCDIKINLNTNQVIKKSGSVNFEGNAMMYAAIFSDKGIYECQVQRLMKRLGSLAKLYDDKANLISGKGCDSNLNLIELKTLAENIESSKGLGPLQTLAEQIKKENNLGSCKLW